MPTATSPDPLPFDPALTEPEQAIVREEAGILAGLREALVHFRPAWKDPNYDESLLELRDSLGEAHEDELPQIVAQMDRLASLSAHQQRQSPAAALPDTESPYFGHMRVRQGGRVRDILIGNETLASLDIPYPIIDWRHAPISRIFYCYGEGDEYEERFGGRVVEGQVLALRKVLIAKGRLLRVDCPQGVYQLANGRWRRLERDRPRMHGGSGSALRPSMMGPPRLGIENGKEAGGLAAPGLSDRHLPLITGLIDAEQFAVITRPDSGIVVIDGGAGSGKTTIALHRIAYLCHLNPERFRPDQMLVVVFNKALAAYVSQLLPALGVRGVRIHVLDDLLEQLRHRHFPGLPGEYSDGTPTAVIRFKQHPATLDYLKERVAARTREIGRGFETALGDAPGATQALEGWRALAGQPLLARIEQFAQWVRGSAILPGVGKFGADWLARQRLKPSLDELAPAGGITPALILSVWEEACLQLPALTEGMGRLAPGAFTPGELESVRNWAFRYYSEREDYQAQKEAPRPEREDGDDPPPPPAPVPSLDREDDTLLLLLYEEMWAPLRSSKKKPLKVAHLTVDEAQDFSALELRALISLVADPPSVTLAGDTEQRMILHNHVTRWEDVLEQLGLKGTSISPLKVGYRSTAEIMRFALHVLGPLHTDRPWTPTREGVPVELLRFAHPGQAVAFLAEALRHLMRSEPEANVALIARHPVQAEIYFQGLAKSELPRLTRVAEQNFSFQPGIEVTDITQVKGLEYDYVVLLDVDQATYPDDTQSRYLLHIGATRAAHQLWLVSCRTPSPLLPEDLSAHLV
jgi:DNA helicase-2/ATP-dependent DNA helicase PcrA